MLQTTLIEAIDAWFRQKQRDLPWRNNRSAYRVWLSEIMLQQTQVATVVAYFNRFIAAFPSVHALAAASEDHVLSLWSGLGYYSRCRNLHKTAKIIVAQYDGLFPDNYEALLALPGVGSYTAGAISAFAFAKAAPVVDGNVMRVFSRIFNDDTMSNTAKGKQHFESLSLALAQQARNVSQWQEGLMELGALICKPKNPDCMQCPANTLCDARRLGTIHDLPKKTAKPSRQPLDIVCAIIGDEQHIWLEKGNGNLFRGLYSPPNAVIEKSSNAMEALSKILFDRQIPNAPTNKNPIIVTRMLTHRDLTLHGFLVPLSLNQHPSTCWIRRNCLNEIGMSAAIRNLLATSLASNANLL